MEYGVHAVLRGSDAGHTYMVAPWTVDGCAAERMGHHILGGTSADGPVSRHGATVPVDMALWSLHADARSSTCGQDGSVRVASGVGNPRPFSFVCAVSDVFNEKAEPL